MKLLYFLLSFQFLLSTTIYVPEDIESIQGGIDLAEDGGHTSVKTTEKYYVDLLQDNLRDSVNGLDGII